MVYNVQLIILTVIISDEWNNESRAWQVGAGIARNDQPLIKPIPAHVSEDDF